MAVYPCVYREHAIRDFHSISLGGLSLCIQGTLLRSASLRFALRFIPVHTGNILLGIAPVAAWAVYPCAYREHGCYCYQLVFYCGLSLCIQGTLKCLKHHKHNSRFIPVHTGNIDRVPQ